MAKATVLSSNPRDRASCWSKLSFWWLYPLLVKGSRKPLEEGDLYDVSIDDASLRLGNLLGSNWEKEVRLSEEKDFKPSYVRAIARTFGPRYALNGAILFLEECVFKIGGPVLLAYYIRSFNDAPGGTLAPWGFLFALGIVVSNMSAICCHHPYFYMAQCVGMRIRIASCALIYRKALRLSSKALGETTVGQIVNLLSNDVNRFDIGVNFLHYLWIGPLQTLISTVILWREFGPSCLAGITLIFLYVIILSYMGKAFSRLRSATASLTDERVRIMSEIVNAMSVIKMYAWEKPLTAMVERARKMEIDVIMRANYLRACNLSIFFTSNKIVIMLILLTFVLTGNIVTAEKVFLASSLINNIQLSMTLFFSAAISLGSEAYVSCQRIQTFLEMEEIEDSNKISDSNLRPKPQDCSLECDAIQAQWDASSGDATLRGVSLSAKAGEVIALVGAVGAGKSSLLQAILRELPITAGSITVKGKISYASQEPWLFSGSVKENVLFGQPFDADRYAEVIRVCALERDLELFQEGEDTMVGERGVCLSGGQKARINLARAVYLDADVYLLDDPLSAVDSHVGRHLFERCVAGFLRRKVVVLATHQLHFLKSATRLLVLKNGCVEAEGSYAQMENIGINLSEIVTEQEEEEEEEGEEEKTDTQKHADERETHLEQRRIKRVAVLRRASESWNLLHGSNKDVRGALSDSTSFLSAPHGEGSLLSLHNDDGDQNKEDLSSSNQNSKDPKEPFAETKSKGSVRGQIYLKYFLSGGGPFLFLLLLLLIVFSEVLTTGSSFWLSHWTNSEQLYAERLLQNVTLDFRNETGDAVAVENRSFFLYAYAAITALLMITALVRTVLFFRVCMTSSKNLHNQMFAAIIRVPMVFFDTHPIGQILNRFTKDIGQVDDLLPTAMYDFIIIMFTFAGIIATILYLNLWMLVPTVVLGCVFSFLRWGYLAFSREIKRIEGITRSPVFSHLSATLQGLPTIRAFKAQAAAASRFDHYQNKHTSAWFLFVSSARIFGAYLDILSNIYTGIVVFSFLFRKGDVLGGDVGLGVNMAMMLAGMFQWGVKQSAEVENHMTSVERILEYSAVTPEVPCKDSGKVAKKEGWPSEGKLTFEKVSLYYHADQPPVLKNLNFTIESTEKIGIVGRTGAGKSSLLSCLFRITRPAGRIVIDGVETDTLLLEDLRRSLSIIPQDPTLFTGTVRYNLDPFSEYTDDQIWNALEEVQLKEPVVEMSGNLSAHVSEGGHNLSVGQRQLMCLARAILKHNKILVMDEATANVDPETDAWIQRTIRDKFTDCTVLTIAHRLHTIIDSHKVMVMDSGQLKEFAPPHELLQDPSSMFSSLVDETGEETSRQLRIMAEEAYNKNRGRMTSEATQGDCHRSSNEVLFLSTTTKDASQLIETSTRSTTT